MRTIRASPGAKRRRSAVAGGVSDGGGGTGGVALGGAGFGRGPAVPFSTVAAARGFSASTGGAGGGGGDTRTGATRRISTGRLGIGHRNEGPPRSATIAAPCSTD